MIHIGIACNPFWSRPPAWARDAQWMRDTRHPSGPKGAIAAIDDRAGFVGSADLQTVSDHGYLTVDAERFLDVLRACAGVVRVTLECDAREIRGSKFPAGVFHGSIIAAAQRVPRLQLHLIAAPQWRRWFGLAGLPRDATHQLAHSLFPDAAHRHADATLVAEYGRRRWSGKAAA